jgi:hypothetical protein
MVELVELDEPSSRVVLVVESRLVLVEGPLSMVGPVVALSAMLVTVRSSTLVEVRSSSIVPPDAVACVREEDAMEPPDTTLERGFESRPAPSPDADAVPTSSPAAATAVITPISFRNIKYLLG